MLTNNNTNSNKIFSDSRKYIRWRIVSIVVVGIMVGSAMYAASFVYKNIYVTLANANTIVVLSSNLGVDAVDIKNYNLAEEKKKKKMEDYSWPKDLRVIFKYENNFNTSTSTTTTKP